MNPTIEHHTHLPASVVAIVVGLVGLILDWFLGVAMVGWGWAIIAGVVCAAMVLIGFLKLWAE